MSQDFNDPTVKYPRPSSPVVPVKLGLDDTIQFRCHKGIACFNKCCENINIMLTPYDILRLKNRLGITSAGVPGKPRDRVRDGRPRPAGHQDEKPSPTAPPASSWTPEGCGVYEDRPTACRYYALGATTMRAKDSSTPRISISW